MPCLLMNNILTKSVGISTSISNHFYSCRSLGDVTNSNIDFDQPDITEICAMTIMYKCTSINQLHFVK